MKGQRRSHAGRHAAHDETWEPRPASTVTTGTAPAETPGLVLLPNALKPPPPLFPTPAGGPVPEGLELETGACLLCHEQVVPIPPVAENGEPFPLCADIAACTERWVTRRAALAAGEPGAGTAAPDETSPASPEAGDGAAGADSSGERDPVPAAQDDQPPKET